LNLLACQDVVCNRGTVRATEETQMNSILLLAAFALLMGSIVAPARAAGCLKGAAVGGVAGHYAGHHGVLGASSRVRHRSS
jgi:hypothetical protein